MSNGQTDPIDPPTKFEDWKDDKVEEALTRFHDDTVRRAEALIDWYNKRGSQMGTRSRRVRFLAIIVGTVGALLPVLGIAIDPISIAVKDATVAFESGNLGYVFLALAAALVTADSAFGWSSSWMRFRTTQLELQQLLAGFRFDWAIEMAKLNGRRPETEEREALLRLQRAFDESVQAAAEAETTTWVQEFRASLAELARTYKTSAAERAPGAIDVRVLNAAKADGELNVRIDRRQAGSCIAGSYQLTSVPPGPHAVEVSGTINGKATGASGSAVVRPGEVAKLELSLAE
jgi:hypothetical protein